MGLRRYRTKRDFKKTQEPLGKSRRGPPTASRAFVIQEHHARRLHFDFRLEERGVLNSWAITREPSLDPSARRLAVETEDHPLEYAGSRARFREPIRGRSGEHLGSWNIRERDALA